MNIIHFLENETSSNPGGFGAESIPIAIGTSAEQPYYIESLEDLRCVWVRNKSTNSLYKTTENRVGLINRL